MKIKVPQIEIDKDSPFKHDLLDRAESADILTELIKSIAEPSVICIDAEWGNGKTTFLRMWRQHLENKGFSTLYFNAWENDFSNDALVSLIGEIEIGIEEVKFRKGNKSKVKKHFDKAKKIGASLVKNVIPTAARIATGGLLNFDNITEDALSSLSGKLAEEQINKYELSKKSIQNFKNELTVFAKELSTQSENEIVPIVFFIDELDRCRPIFALEVLEKAKHFFNVTNIIFVLAVDRLQIGHSIKSVYGQGMDVNGYLKRFIDFDYVLPRPKKGKFAKSLFHRFGLDGFFNDRRSSYEMAHEHGQISELFSELFSIFNLSLREQEHCFSQLSLAIRTTQENYKLYPFLLIPLIVLKIKEPTIYKNFIERRTTPDDVLNCIRNKPGGEVFVKDRYGMAIEAYFVAACSRSNHTNEFMKPYEELIKHPETSEEMCKRAKYILELLQSIEMRFSYQMLDYAVGKIEIASRFTSDL